MLKNATKALKNYFEHQMRMSKERMQDTVYFENITYINKFVDGDYDKLDDIIYEHYKMHSDPKSNILFTIRENEDAHIISDILVSKIMSMYIHIKDDDMLMYKVYFNLYTDTYKDDVESVRLEIGMTNDDDGVKYTERLHSSLDSFQSWNSIIEIILHDIMENHLYRLDKVTISRITKILNGQSNNKFDDKRMECIVRGHLDKYKNTSRVDIQII